MSKIIFFGTSEFAVPSLQALLADGRFEVVAVVTQPDRPVGRHAKLTPSPVMSVIARHEAISFPIFQPEKISELKDKLPPADAFVIVSYGKILPTWLLELPPHGIINVHPSLLPRWRGPSPIQAAIMAGDTTTGVTIMKIDAEMDHGPILAQAEVPIAPDETGGALHDRLAAFGAQLLPDILTKYLEGRIVPQEQDHTQATFCKILTREDGKIDWNKTSTEIEHQVRAYDPWPGTWIDLDGKRLKIIALRVRPNDASHPPGTRFVWKGRPSVACGQFTSVELVTVQPEGKRVMSGEDFVKGCRLWSDQ